MENPIKMVYQFNKQAGLLDAGYDDFLESSMLVEEAIEGLSPRFEHLYNDRGISIIESSAETRPKDIARDFVSWVNDGSAPDDAQRLDKACDAVIIALGSIFKLGLNPAQATRALNIVMRHNFAKLSMPKDEFGKLMKPADFVGPEEELQKLLDER